MSIPTLAYQSATPEFVQAAELVDLARKHSQVGNYQASLELYRKANDLVPNHPEIINGLGTALRMVGDTEMARKVFLKAESLEPSHPRVMLNLCAMANSEGEHELADCFLHEARRRNSEHINVRWFDAMRLLRQMRYREAWPLFECRFDLQGQRAEVNTAGATFWQGQEGAKLVLLREQGFGDCIQMIRFVSTVSRQTEIVAVESPPELRRLFQHNYPHVPFMPVVEHVITEGISVLPMLSMGNILNLSAEDISGKAYLEPLPVDIHAWSSTLGVRRRRKGVLVPRIAIFWAGNPRHANDRQRSIPLEAMLALLEKFDFDWLILQKDVNPDDKTKFPASCRFIGQYLHDFADTAAVLSQVDLLIGVDSSPIHLAGALGIESWLLLPMASDWRWGLEGKKTVWYDSIRLFRQECFREWEKPLQKIANALSERFDVNV